MSAVCIVLADNKLVSRVAEKHDDGMLKMHL